MQECTPLRKKNYLNPQEAIKLYNLSARKFYRLIKEEQDFLGSYKTRKLIIRTAFEEYLSIPENMAALKKELPRTTEGERKKVISNG